MKTLDAIYGVPDEEPVVQLFLPDGGQRGEIKYRAGRLELELWAPEGKTTWVVDADQLVHVIGLAKDRLVPDA